MSSQTPVTITAFITEASNPSPKSGAAPLSSRSSRHKMRFKQRGGKAVLVAPGQEWVGQGARMPRAWWQGWDVVPRGAGARGHLLLVAAAVVLGSALLALLWREATAPSSSLLGPSPQGHVRRTATNVPSIAFLSIFRHMVSKSISLDSVVSWKLKLCSSVVRKRKSSIRASASPGHIRFPGGTEGGKMSTALDSA